MSEEQFTSEKAYTTSQIADMVGIAEPTVRKYAQMLEKAGYRFIKDDFGTRTYVDKDVMAIRELKEIRTKTNMPVENVAVMIASKYGDSAAIRPISGVDTAELVPAEQSIHRYDALSHEQLTALINQMTEKFDNTVSALLHRIDQQDAMLRELTETQKAIAAVSEATPTAEGLASEVMQQVRMDLEILEAERNQRLLERDEKLMTVLREIQEQKSKSIWKKIFGG